MLRIRFTGAAAYGCQLGLILLASWLFCAKTHQAAHWRGTYFSMAANLSTASWQLGQPMLVDTAAVNGFDQLPPDQQRTYRFRPAPVSTLTPYVAMQAGYGYICAVARWLCPIGGDSLAVTVLQTALHLGMCAWLLWLLPLGWQRWAFTLLYGANPLIIRYVTYDFYYFWQVIPSFLLVLSQLKKHRLRSIGWSGIGQGTLLGLTFATRPSTLLGTLLLGGVYVRQKQYRLLATTATVALLTGWLLYRPVASAHWRTMYVGIAAYQNPHQPTLSDVAMYRLYEQRLGHPYRYQGTDPAQDKRLAEMLKTEVKRIAITDPLLFAKNAVINTLLAFSPGYVVGGGDLLNYLLAIVGLGVLAWLLRQRQYVYVLGVLATVGMFTPYYPPIPAYLFGAYLLLVIGLIRSRKAG